MPPVKTKSEIEESARKAVDVLYGKGIKDFKIREMLPYISDQQVVGGGLPTEDRRDSWDVQVTFLLDGIQYTVDLLIMEKDGQITNARLIDKMTPLQDKEEPDSAFVLNVIYITGLLKHVRGQTDSAGKL